MKTRLFILTSLIVLAALGIGVASVGGMVTVGTTEPTTAVTTAVDETTPGITGAMPTITIIEPTEGATVPTNSVTIQVDVTDFTLVQPPEETGMAGTTMTTVSPAETTVMATETTMEGTAGTGTMSGHIHYYMDAIPPTTAGEPAVNGSLIADPNTTAAATTTETTAAGAGETTTTAAGGVAETTTTAEAATTNPTTVTSANTVYTFQNVPPGEHIFAVQLVNSDHTPLTPPVTAIVNVTVSGTMGMGAGTTMTTAETMATVAAETTTPGIGIATPTTMPAA